MYRFIIIFILITGAVYAQTYLDSTASINDRVEDLLSRMTLAEKIGQMTQAERSALDSDQDITTYFLGSLLSGGGSAPENNSAVGWADMYDNFQEKALATRLAIPMIYGIDAVHGHNNVKGAVIFPHNIGLGATRNADLVKEVSKITALEVAGTGIDWTFAPCIAVPRNISWGRTYEGFGETPELQVMMAGPAVEGFQGADLADPNSILACAKHYVGDGGTTNGIDQGNTEVDEQMLREIHLPGYIEAVNAGVGSVMASYNSWNGQKLHGYKYLLTDVLKNELGFEGFVVSDWAGIDQIPGDYASDVENSINAGIDMVMTPYNYAEFISTLTSLVNEGKVSQERIDDAVRRILYQKFALGLFEHPYTKRSLTARVGSAAHREVGRQAVRESMVLMALKDDVLPLSKDGQKILVAGRHANNIGLQCGGWSISWQGQSGNITTGTTILQGIQNTTGSSEIVYSEDGSSGTNADVAVVVVGEEPYAEGAGDSDQLYLSAEDVLLVRHLKNEGLKVILVLISGRPLIIDSVLPYTDAVFAAWLPGTEGQGVADILFGDYQPTGKLGHSWPRSMDQVPVNAGDQNYDPLYDYDHGILFSGNYPAGTAPEFYAGAVSTDGGRISINFTRDLNAVNISVSDFVVKVNDVPVVLTSVVPDANDVKTLNLILQEAVADGEDIVLEYSGSNLQSVDGIVVDPFGPVAIFNNFDAANVYVSVPAVIQAEDYFAMQGIQTENCTDVGGGLNVGWIDAGDWISWKISVPQTKAYRIKYRVASLNAGGQATTQLNDVPLIVTSFPVTEGWQNWTTVDQEISLEAGESILKLVCNVGGFNVNWIAIEELTTIIKTEENIPRRTHLYQNYPNPFNPQTLIGFEIDKTSLVRLNLYDMQGRHVKTLADVRYRPGKYAIRVNMSDLPSGTYLYKMITGSYSETRKMLFLR